MQVLAVDDAAAAAGPHLPHVLGHIGAIMAP
jgi:hypothetical protein